MAPAPRSVAGGSKTSKGLFAFLSSFGKNSFFSGFVTETRRFSDGCTSHPALFLTHPSFQFVEMIAVSGARTNLATEKQTVGIEQEKGLIFVLDVVIAMASTLQ